MTPTETTLRTVADRHLSGLDPAGPGYALRVTLGGVPRLERYAGMASVEHQVPIGPDTAFNLASVTKLFVAVSIARLHEQGRLDWARTLGEFWPDLRPPAARLVIADLLAHGSGLDDSLVAEVHARKRPTCNADILEALRAAPDRVQVSNPGVFRYSNFGYLLLTLLVERLASRPFDAFVREQIAPAAGMRDFQVFGLPRFVVPHRADGYGRAPDDPRWAIQHSGGLTVGDGGACVSAPDLGAFALAFLDDRLVKAETRRAMLTPRIPVEPGVRYGLGWRLRDGQDPQAIFHTGTDAGFANMVACRLDERRVVVLLSNYAGRFISARKPLVWDLLDAG